MCGTLQVLIAKRLVVPLGLAIPCRAAACISWHLAPGTAADKTLYRLHALAQQTITIPTHLGIYIIPQLPEFA